MRLAIVAVTLVTLVVLTVAASALAVSWSDTQSSPGIHRRTIWDETQVQIREITPDGGLSGVNHTGYIHMQLTFKPTTSDFDMYLVRSDGEIVGEVGTAGLLPGKEFVDFEVKDVENQTTDWKNVYVDGEIDDIIEYMVGDKYYLVVVAYNGTASYQIWGYYPQIDLEEGDYDVDSPSNYYYQMFRFPKSVTSWATLTGPRYGGPYDFRPTSMGEGRCRLEWPADADAKVRTYDPTLAPMPYNVEQYLYAGLMWDEVLANYWVYDPDYLDTENYLPDFHDDDPFNLVDPTADWYGFNDAYEVAENELEAELLDGAWAQGIAHYVPSLFLAYKDATAGPAGGLQTGRSTMGYRAILTWPENLWLKKVVKYSSYYKVYGRYSLEGAAVQIGTPVEIWKKTATTGWKYLKTVKTVDDKGNWSTKLTPGVTWTIQARAAGHPATGLEIEKSLTRVLKAL